MILPTTQSFKNILALLALTIITGAAAMQSSRSTTCGCGDAMPLSAHTDTYICDVCGKKDIPKGTPMLGCRKCNWDACLECTNRSVESPSPWPFVPYVDSWPFVAYEIFAQEQYRVTGVHKHIPKPRTRYVSRRFTEEEARECMKSSDDRKWVSEIRLTKITIAEYNMYNYIQDSMLPPDCEWCNGTGDAESPDDLLDCRPGEVVIDNRPPHDPDCKDCNGTGIRGGGNPDIRASEYRTTELLWAREQVKPTMVTKCPDGHTLRRLYHEESRECDVCQEQLAPGALMHSCKECSYDACQHHR